jgi:hypothetical protein
VRAELFSGAAALAEPLFDPASLAGQQSADASFAMLHGLYWLAANVAYDRPTVLAIDDLHWADTPSLRWLCYLARRCSTSGPRPFGAPSRCGSRGCPSRRGR